MNDAPRFTKGADQAASGDGFPRTVRNWATGISAGPPNEASQRLNFTVSNNNPGLFSVQPAISPGGTLTFTPRLNAEGIATVSVKLSDDDTAGGPAITTAEQEFTITLYKTIVATPGPPQSPPPPVYVPTNRTVVLTNTSGGGAHLWYRNGVVLHDGDGSDELSLLLKRGAVFGSSSNVLTIVGYQNADGGTYEHRSADSPDSPVTIRQIQVLSDRTNLRPALLEDRLDASRQSVEIQPTGWAFGTTANFATEVVKAGANTYAVTGWITWKATANGSAQWTTAGSGYQTKLYVFVEDGQAGQLKLVTSDEGHRGGYGTSLVQWDCTAGTNYHLGLGGDRGDVMLGWISDGDTSGTPMISIATDADRPFASGQVVRPGATNIKLSATLSQPIPTGLSYQWTRNGEDVAGANYLGTKTTDLTVKVVGEADLGVYQLEISRGDEIWRSPPVILEIGFGDVSNVPSNYDRTDLAADIESDATIPLATARQPRLMGLAPSAGTIISDNWRPRGLAGSDATNLLGGSSRWYYLPSRTDANSSSPGLVTVRTTSSEFPPVLDVYELDAANQFVLVTRSGPVTNLHGANTSYTAEAYYIAHDTKKYLAAVDGQNAINGLFELTWNIVRGPIGDNFRWFDMIPTADGEIEIDLSPDTNIKTLYLVLEGTDYPNLRSVPITDNGAEAPPTWARFHAVPGQIYVALVDARDENPDAIDFRWRMLPAALKVEFDGAQVRVHWGAGGGRLESAPGLGGPWSKVTNLKANGSEMEVRLPPDHHTQIFRLVPE
uniref:Ig-like domain-containing protein n=1 Tax=uncultured prokaryote EC6 TaxID=672204 RepID=D3W8K5_9ZZZZ|nr:hypothetical protein [uncultured prokaryote EC6]